MNSIQVLTKYAVLLTAIADNCGAAHGLTAEQTEANNARKASVAASIREYAKATAADGVGEQEGQEALAMLLTAKQVKGGTIKGYGASFRGYRKMIADGAKGKEGKALVDVANTGDAQLYVASDEVKAARDAKERIREATKGWKASELAELAEFAEALNKDRTKDVTESVVPESTESREARAA